MTAPLMWRIHLQASAGRRVIEGYMYIIDDIKAADKAYAISVIRTMPVRLHYIRNTYSI